VLDKHQLIQSFSDIAKEKNIDRTEIGTILEELFKSLIERQYGQADNCDVIVNIDRGELEIYQNKVVVEDVDNPGTEISLKDAQKIEPEMAVGDDFVDVIDPTSFGRRLVVAAKQFLSQQIRDIEKQHTFENYFTRVGEVVIGDVRQVNRDSIHIHIDQSELTMPRTEAIANERYRRGETLRALVKSVEMTSRGPDILVSRSDNRFLAKLFEMEVPEIEDGIIEILAIARAPGLRAKIIVRSHDRRIDAVGACVGMRGSRIQAVVRELNGEKIDVINKSEQPEVLISRALSPAKPLNLYIDDDAKFCVAVFDNEEMDSGIGRNYQNINLAAQVTGYKIEAVSQSEYEGVSKSSSEEIFIEQIRTITERMTTLLSEGGVNTVADFKEASRDDLLAVKGLGEKMLETIEERIGIYLTSLDKRHETDESPSTPEIPNKESGMSNAAEIEDESDEVNIVAEPDQINELSGYSQTSSESNHLKNSTEETQNSSNLHDEVTSEEVTTGSEANLTSSESPVESGQTGSEELQELDS
tara:strand:- start:985 stop:2571 length:1587 start_codon:yes stop_codon:yes gene_type:complete